MELEWITIPQDDDMIQYAKKIKLHRKTVTLPLGAVAGGYTDKGMPLY